MKIRKSYLLYAILVSLLPAGGAASVNYDHDYRLMVVSVNDGLPQQAVTTIAQDANGVIWLGTFDGLCRYDGYSLKNYHSIPGRKGTLPSNRITATLVESDGHLWIGTEGNPCLCVYDPDTDSFITPPGQQWEHCTALAQGADKEIWIATGSGLFTFVPPPDGGKSQLSPHKVSIPATGVGTIKEIARSGGGVWALSSGTLLRFNHKGEMTAVYDEPFIRTATSICCDSLSNLFLFTPEALYTIGNDDDKLRRADILPIPSTMVQLGGNLYIAAVEQQGVAVMERIGEGKFILKQNIRGSKSFFSGNMVRSLLIDRSGCLWMGSRRNGAGIIDLRAKPFHILPMPDDGIYHLIRCITRDSKGTLWFGTQRAGVYKIENGRYESFGIDPRQNFNAIFEDRDKNIWICSHLDIYLYRNGRMQSLRQVPGIPAAILAKVQASAIAQDAAGAIWIGGTGKLLRIKNINSAHPELELFDDPYTYDIYCMRYDAPANRLWIGSRSRGLFLANLDDASDNISSYSELSYNNRRLISNQIWNINPGNDGVMWLSTDSGVRGLRIAEGDTTIIGFPKRPRLSESKIMCVQEDSSGCLWLNSSQGLLRYNPKTDFYREYLFSDGLCSNTTTEAGYTDTDGNIYIGTINGINRFDPRQINDGDYVSAPLITALRVNNQPVAPDSLHRRGSPLHHSILFADRVNITHRNNNFTFEFLAPDYKAPSRIRYAYKLEGQDKQWNYATADNRTASYNRLPAGYYTFMVRASNSDGVWSDTTRQISVTVHPAPWNTWWAWMLYLIALLAVIYTIIRYYTIQYRLKKDMQIEHIQREHERILNETKLRFHTNISHEIRTSLSLISAPLDDIIGNGSEDDRQERLAIMKRNVGNLEQLVSQFLDLERIEKDAMSLCVERTDIIRLAAAICARFREVARSKGIELEMIGEHASAEGLFDPDKIIKIVSNLLSNALKFTPAGGRVTLFAGQENDRVELAVEDTGCGIAPHDLEHIFDRFYQSDSSRNGGTGIGLALVKNLVELHRGKITAVSRPGEGSIFTVSLPFTDEYYTDVERLPVAPGTPVYESVEPVASRPTVMIVEDNPDMASYLRMNIQQNYNVIMDESVESAMVKVLQHMPDLVLLDVMLQGSDGLELCEKLKTNILTNHIPVLILSAKDTPGDIALGYAKGAEDYMLKPFSTEVLMMKINNIIRYRRRAASDDTRDGKEDDQSRANPFIERLETIIRDNISEPDFNINTICEKMGISRTQLYRKLQAITDRSISDMVRDHRMRIAHELLRSGKYNVSEVMYLVGINSNSYFTRTFKEYFGTLPSEMIKKGAV